MRNLKLSLSAATLTLALSLAVIAGPGSVQAGEAAEGISTAALNIPPRQSNGDILKLAHASMSRLGTETVAALAGKGLSRNERVDYYRTLISGSLDVKVLARFMVGKTWKTMSREKRETYLAVFGDFIVHSYAARLGAFEIKKFEIKETKFTGKDKKDVLVKSRISRSGNMPINAVWRLRHRGDRFVILDLSVQGISVAVTMRQEFAGILHKTGGIDGLILTLKDRIA